MSLKLGSNSNYLSLVRDVKRKLSVEFIVTAQCLPGFYNVYKTRLKQASYKLKWIKLYYPER